jgi:hypothetical protein
MLSIFPGKYTQEVKANPVSGSACASADGTSWIGRNVNPEVEFIEKQNP